MVCEKPWQAMQAAATLKATWIRRRRVACRQRASTSTCGTAAAARDTLLVDSGDVDQRWRRAARVVKATYHHPYQMHGSIGTSCAVADVQDGKATIWSATQAVYPLRITSAMLLGLPPEDVRVDLPEGAGCYGINGADTVSYDAALLSQAVGRPVRVQLSRAGRDGVGELRLRRT